MVLVEKHVLLIRKYTLLLILVMLISGCGADPGGSSQPGQTTDAGHLSTGPAASQTESSAPEVSGTAPLPTMSTMVPSGIEKADSVEPAQETHGPTPKPSAIPEQTPELTDAPIPSPTSPASGPKTDFPKDMVTDDDLVLIYNDKELFLDMKKEDLISVINCPILNTEIDNSFDESIVETILFEDNTEAIITGDTLYKLTVRDSKYVTPRGLRVGDPVEKLIDLYGETEFIHDGIYDYEHFSGYHLFDVTAENGIVTEITIHMVM